MYIVLNASSTTDSNIQCSKKNTLKWLAILSYYIRWGVNRLQECLDMHVKNGLRAVLIFGVSQQAIKVYITNNLLVSM